MAKFYFQNEKAPFRGFFTLALTGDPPPVDWIVANITKALPQCKPCFCTGDLSARLKSFGEDLTAMRDNLGSKATSVENSLVRCPGGSTTNHSRQQRPPSGINHDFEIRCYTR